MWSRSKLAAVSVALSIAGGSVAGADPPASLDAVRWRGVESVAVAELQAVIETRARGWRFWRERPVLDPTALFADAERITAVYRRRGYYRADVRAEVEPTAAGRVAVVFVVAEGRPVRVATRSVELRPPVDGLATELDPALLLAELPCGEGDVFDVRDYRRAREALLEALAEEGYPSARLEGGADVDPDAGDARIAWTVHTGPFVRIGEVRVSGAEHTDPALVRDEAALAVEDPLRPSDLEAARRRLLDLGLFRSVVVEPDRPKDEEAPAGEVPAEERWPLEIRVRERPPRTLKLGVGYASEERVRGLAEWEHRNLLGRARTLRVRGRYSSLRTSGSVGVEWPRFLEQRVLGETRLEASRERLPTYDADRLVWTAKLSRPLRWGWKGSLGYALDRSKVDDVSPASAAVLDDPTGTTILSLVQLGLERSTVDVPADPTRGVRVALEAELSPRALRSDVSYVGSSVGLRGYRPVGPVVVAGRLDAAVLLPYGATAADEIPLTKRLFAGGADSVRGFDYQELGPLDAAEEPVGGTTLLEGSVELRFPLADVPRAGRLGGVLFVDAGQVDLDPLHVEFDQIRYSVGAGLRLATPVGPLRIDYGYVLNPPGDLDRSRFHLSVGHAF